MLQALRSDIVKPQILYKPKIKSGFEKRQCNSDFVTWLMKMQSKWQHWNFSSRSLVSSLCMANVASLTKCSQSGNIRNLVQDHQFLACSLRSLGLKFSEKFSSRSVLLVFSVQFKIHALQDQLVKVQQFKITTNFSSSSRQPLQHYAT